MAAKLRAAGLAGALNFDTRNERPWQRLTVKLSSSPMAKILLAVTTCSRQA